MSWEEIKQKVEYQVEYRKTFFDLVSYDPDCFPHFVMDLSTIKINLGRRQGHSTFIVNNVQPGDLVVAYRYGTAQHIAPMLREKNVQLLPSQTMANTIRGRRVETNIWFDNFSSYTEEERKTFRLLLTLSYDVKAKPFIYQMG